MINNSANKKQQHKTEPKPDRGNQFLFGKAVLLIGNDTAVLQNLVTQLAQKGADIALLCWQLPLDAARKMEALVQSFGQRLILIERAENQRFSVEQLIYNLINRWGHFDIFIDVSTYAGSKTAVPNETGEEAQQPAWLSPQMQLTRTVLEEIARA